MSGGLKPINNYPLQMMLEEINKLKEKLQLAELSAGMYYKQVQMLNKHVDLETCLEIQIRIWGNPTRFK